MFFRTLFRMTHRSQLPRKTTHCSRVRVRSTAPFPGSIPRLPNHIEQGACNKEMKIDLILTALSYSLRRALGPQTFDYDWFSEDDNSEIVEIWGDYLKLWGHLQLFYFTVQFPSWFKAGSASTKSVRFEDTEDNKQERKVARFDDEMQNSVFVRVWRTFNWNARQRILQYVSIINHAVYFW